MPDDASNVQQGIVDLINPGLTGCTIWAARPMAEWRERGYVPDSDDEDDVSLSAARLPTPPAVPDPPHEHELDVGQEGKTPEAPEEAGAIVPAGNKYNVPSQRTETVQTGEQRPAEGEFLHLNSTFEAVAGETKENGPRFDESQANHTHATDTEDPLPAASVSDQLQATLEHGLHSVQEVLGNASMGARAASVNRSDTSSPLSSIRSLADDDDIREDANHGTPAPVQSIRHMTTEPQSWRYQENSPPRFSGRDLRRRNPIQVHPYALEDARYQQELKARGLQPLRIAPGSSEMRLNSVADDTQGSDLFSSSAMEDSAESESFRNLRSTEHSQSHLSSIVTRAERRSASPALSEEDDLPDLSTLLEGEIPGLRARKRRKVAHKAAKQAEQPSEHDEFHVPELPPADLDLFQDGDVDIDMFNIPPSPPRTSSSIDSNPLLVHSKLSGQNALNTPQRPLPTPAASSLTRAHEDTQINDQSTKRLPLVAADIQRGRGIQSLQRRIKGVLPASWLTLDRHEQTRKDGLLRPPANPPVKQLGVKGVAQRVRTDRLQTSHTETIDVSVVESSDEGPLEPAFSPSAKMRTDWASEMFEDDDDFEASLDDVVKDKGVNATTPQRSRGGRRVRVSATKRQQTLNESFDTSRRSHLPRTGLPQTGPKRKKQPTSNYHIQPRPRSRHQKPRPVSLQLGILDAPDVVQLPIDDQPQFLRVAARQARICRNKTLRTLLDYELSPHASDISNSSTTPKITANHSPDQLDSLKTSTAATIHRILVRQVGTAASAIPEKTTGPRLSSTRTDNWTRGTSGSFVRQLDGPANAPLPKRLLSYYRNRSGKGRLVSSLAQARQPRSAQVETIQSRTAPLLEQSLNLCPPEANTAQFQARHKRKPQHRKTLPRSSPPRSSTPQLPPEAQKWATFLKESETPSLMAGTFYHESTLIGSLDVAKTIRKTVVTPRNLHVNTRLTQSINRLQIGGPYIWGAWNPMVASQLKKLFNDTYDDCPLVVESDYASLTPVLPEVRLYMRDIIHYINDVLCFEEPTDRASFVTTCYEVLVGILDVTLDEKTSLLPSEEDNILHLLTHLAVVSFQVSHIAATPEIPATIPPGLQARVWRIFDSIIWRMLSLALSSRGLAKLKEYQTSINARSVWEKGIRMEFPQIDALVIASHLCPGKPTGKSCSTMVGEILATRVDSIENFHTTDRLMEVMYFIRAIMPYSAVDASGSHISRMPTTEDFSSIWPSIVPVFEAFLRSRTRSQDKYSPDNLISRTYIQDCLRIATEWGWIECAGLVDLLRIRYGTNEMDALFADMGSDSRAYLDDYAEVQRIRAHDANDSGFDTFLKLIIVSGQQKAGRGEKISRLGTSRLGSFIFSLVPNSGQVLRKDQDHDLRVLEPIQNRHDLYTVLYFISPFETKMRLLQQIWSLVDFSQSHLSACKISLKTLVRLTRFQISTNEDPRMLHNFANRFQAMAKRMEEQFDVAKMAAFEGIGGELSGGKVRSHVARITRFNQKQIQDLLVSILRAWSFCIRSCRTATQARYLMFGDNLAAVMQLCTRTMAINAVEGDDIVALRDEVVEAMVSVFSTYINTWLPKSETPRELIEELQKVLRGVLSTQLGRFDQCTGGILESLTHCWHALAKKSVDGGFRSWHHYLFRGGWDAWQAFDDTWHKRQYEVLFAALFVESVRGDMDLSCNESLALTFPKTHPVNRGSFQDLWGESQPLMVELWIGSLLVPEKRFKFQAHHTMELMRLEAEDNPLMFDLPLVVFEDGVLVQVDLDELIAARTTLVLALLRNMNKITTRPDPQYKNRGPTKAECSAIVKAMIALMKQYLAELEQDSAEQTIYAEFVRRVLIEMRIHTTHLQPVPDDFEYMPGKFLTSIVDAILLKLNLYKQKVVKHGLEKHMVVYFHTTAERAAVLNQQETFKRQLIGVFMNLSPEAISDTQGLAADARFRTLFFQNVFPPYLERIFTGSGSIIGRPILSCILTVYEKLRCRHGFWTKEYLEGFTTATLSLLATLKTALESSITSPERIFSVAEQLSTFTMLCCLMYEILCRCEEMELAFGEFGVLDDVWEYLHFFYHYTVKVTIRPPCALPEALLHDDMEPELKDPTLSAADAAMLTYSGRELTDIVDSKWVPGPHGTWWINKAGGKREQVRGGHVVGCWADEVRWMQVAVEKYQRAYTAALNAQ